MNNNRVGLNSPGGGGAGPNLLVTFAATQRVDMTTHPKFVLGDKTAHFSRAKIPLCGGQYVPHSLCQTISLELVCASNSS